MIWLTPYRDVLPPLTTEEKEMLRKSIEREGIRVPCFATEDGRIIDGHNRLEIRPDAPVQTIPGSSDWSDEECLAWVYRSNTERRNLSPDQKHDIRKKQQDAARKLYATGKWTQEKLAELFGVAQQRISDWLLHDTGSGSTQHSRVKIPNGQIPIITARLEAGESQNQIAADYGVNRSTICRIAARATKQVKAAEPLETCDVPDLWELVNDGITFGTIYADPPWQYGNQGTRAATDNHYPTMTMDELIALPVGRLAAMPSHLHLWVTSSFLPEGLRLMKEWGFEYKTNFVWKKPQIGLGNYFRMNHEQMLVGVRGSLTFAEHDIPSCQEWDRGRHSAKPDDVRDMVARVSPGPRLEMFARTSRNDWMTWGNQIDKDLFTQGVKTYKELRRAKEDSGR